jgi:hypothetical protein
MPLRIDPHSSGQLGRHVEHHLAITHQTLRQPSARAMASLHRPSAICPAARELPQPAIAASTIHKPLTGNHRLSDRIHHRQRVARLVRINADHHIVAHRHRLLTDPTEHREAGNATTGSANLSRATTPRADPASRRPFVSQNAKDDGSRLASEPTEPNT